MSGGVYLSMLYEASSPCPSLYVVSLVCGHCRFFGGCFLRLLVLVDSSLLCIFCCVYSGRNYDKPGVLSVARCHSLCVILLKPRAAGFRAYVSQMRASVMGSGATGHFVGESQVALLAYWR